MQISFEFNWTPEDTIQRIKFWYLGRICKSKGHIWKKYNPGTGFLMNYTFMDELFTGLRKTHICQRCLVYKVKKIKQSPAKLNIPKYDELIKTKKKSK